MRTNKVVNIWGDHSRLYVLCRMSFVVVVVDVVGSFGFIADVLLVRWLIGRSVRLLVGWLRSLLFLGLGCWSCCLVVGVLCCK